jgi:translation initiation factor IF-2
MYVCMFVPQGVELNTKSVIYHLLDDLKKDLLGHMANIMETTVKGSATVLKVFAMHGKHKGSEWKVAGCRVEEGSISFSSKYVEAICR